MDLSLKRPRQGDLNLGRDYANLNNAGGRGTGTGRTPPSNYEVNNASNSGTNSIPRQHRSQNVRTEENGRQHLEQVCQLQLQHSYQNQILKYAQWNETEYLLWWHRNQEYQQRLGQEQELAALYRQQSFVPRPTGRFTTETFPQQQQQQQQQQCQQPSLTGSAASNQQQHPRDGRQGQEEAYQLEQRQRGDGVPGPGASSEAELHPRQYPGEKSRKTPAVVAAPTESSSSNILTIPVPASPRTLYNLRPKRIDVNKIDKKSISSPRQKKPTTLKQKMANPRYASPASPTVASNDMIDNDRMNPSGIHLCKYIKYNGKPMYMLRRKSAGISQYIPCYETGDPIMLRMDGTQELEYLPSFYTDRDHRECFKAEDKSERRSQKY